MEYACPLHLKGIGITSMKKYSYTFSISEPCSESWNKMTASDQGKFCLSCQKEVIDFSTMSDEAIIRTIEKSNGKVCGRAKKSQLNRSMQISYNVQRYSPLTSILAGLVVLTLLPACNTETPKAISELAVTPTTKQQVLDLKMVTDTIVVLRGKVLTEHTSDPVVDAEVTVVGTSIKAKVDGAGCFEISLPYTFLESVQFVTIHSKINEETLSEVSAQSVIKKQEQVFWVENNIELEKASVKPSTVNLEQIILGNISIQRSEISPFDYLRNPDNYL